MRREDERRSSERGIRWDHKVDGIGDLLKIDGEL